MIYTSYFGKIQKFPSNFEPICVARWKPKWYNGKIFPTLAPPESLLRWWRASDKNKLDEMNYRKRYMAMLDNLQPTTIVHLIYELAGEKIPILVCFEKDDFCHRHLIAEWLTKNGFRCEEWNG